jgi:Tol biopolymer transport system component
MRNLSRALSALVLAVVATTLIAAAPAQRSDDRWPRFSPDGRSIAFMTTRNAAFDAYVMNADGTGQRRLAPALTLPAGYGGVSWMRDGSILATVSRPTLASGADNGLSAIDFTTFGINGTGGRTLYAGINGERPNASPVNDLVVFEQEHGPYQANPAIDIYTFSPATLSLSMLTHGDGQYIQAAWSPDGSRVAYSCSTAKQPYQICLMQADGSAVRVLTSGAASHEWATWSPDGKRIAFFAEIQKEGHVDASIGIVGSDGSNEHLITGHSGIRRDETPSWSPDGRKIAFQTDRLGHGFRIAVMNVDGTGVTMLTQ